MRAVDRYPLQDKGRYLRMPSVLADAGQGIVAGSNSTNGLIEVRKLNFPEIITGDRLADEPVNSQGRKPVNFHLFARPVAD